MPTRRRRFATALGAVAILAAGTAPAVAQARPDLQLSPEEAAGVLADKTTSNYIVMMEQEPVVAYEGDVAGMASTAPGDGEQVDPEAAAVQRYRQYLDRMGDQILRRSGVDAAEKVYDYSMVFAGFAAEMTEAEAAKVAADDMVVAVVPDEIRQLQTNSTPQFLGLLDRDEGLWRARGIHGDGVIVGVIDSGIRPESPSFTDRARSGPGVGTRYTYTRPPADWEGECESGEGFDADDCNRKLIGARWYNEGYDTAENIKAAFPLEFLSPLDADGHGTHTASTAAGNQFVETEFGRISGIAPRARVAAYKVCWGYSGEGGCATADSVAAIDQAVADGVHVINYSISGTTGNYLDPVEIAFLFAADAGVVVNASAGNDGPGPSTANHPSPWINTVGAGTEEQAFAGALTLGNGEEYDGAPSIANPGTPSLPLIASRELVADGVDVEDAALCLEESLGDASGYMVLCERGAIARVDKSAEVARAGGAAMILGNLTENSLNSDAHSVPTIHVDQGVTAAIYDYLAAAESPTAEQSPAETVTAVAPNVAAFSARGPIGSPDVLKPDFFAPGVDILAAYSPTVGGRDFDYLSGTSMSSPHAAGLSALLKEAHPDWSAAAIQSAMMTTAYQTRTDGSPIEGTPFDYGSGHIQPNSAVDPGLVYDADLVDWLGFVCGTGQLPASFCDDNGIPVLDPSDLNEPNIAIGALAGEQTVERTVTNVGDEPALYEASVDAPAGVRVKVVPPKFLVQPGDSKTFKVEFETMASATFGETVFGQLTWSSSQYDVTSQLVVTPVQLAAPAAVGGTGTDGETSYEVGFGYTGDFAALPHGLNPATKSASTVVDDPANDINTALATGIGITVLPFDVDDGQAFARVALRDVLTDGDDDLDLYVFGPDGSFVGGSGSGTSEETVNILFPDPGQYLVIVHGWQTDGPDANFTLLGWQFSATPGSSNLSVDAPSQATNGGTAEVGVTWSGLAPDDAYLGAVSYSDMNGLIGLTLVEVDTGLLGGG